MPWYGDVDGERGVVESCVLGDATLFLDTKDRITTHQLVHVNKQNNELSYLILPRNA